MTAMGLIETSMFLFFQHFPSLARFPHYLFYSNNLLLLLLLLLPLAGPLLYPIVLEE